MKSKFLAMILVLAMAGTLVACGSDESSESTESASASATETETPTESESAEPSEAEDEDKLAPDGVWETDGERVTIEDDTVTIDFIDDEGEVTETYWVGSFELDEDSDTWTSTRDPNAEMTCESDTIEFTWAGEGDNVYDKLSYAVTNEDGTTKTVTLERTESLGDIEKGVVPDFEDSNNGDTSSTSASPSSSNNKNSDTASVSDNVSASANTGNNTNNDSNSNNSGSTTSNGNTSESTTSNNNSGNTSNNSGNSSNSGSSSSSSGSSSGSNSNNNSSSNSSGSSSSGTTTACSHNYVGNVTKAATCSAAGVKTYTCSKCGASYTESIPATGNHNWQAVYKTVHHDATGHYETVTVSEAYSYSRYICNRCGYYVDRNGISEREAGDIIALHCLDCGSSWSIKTITVPATTQQQWVVDSNAYDEQVVSYYQCSVCGATK